MNMITLSGISEADRKNYYSVTEYSKLSNCSRITIHRAIHYGDLPGTIMVKRAYLIPKFVAKSRCSLIRDRAERYGKEKRGSGDKLYNQVRVSVNDNTRDELMRYVENGKFNSVSEAIRYAIEHTFNIH